MDHRSPHQRFPEESGESIRTLGVDCRAWDGAGDPIRCQKVIDAQGCEFHADTDAAAMSLLDMISLAGSRDNARH